MQFLALRENDFFNNMQLRLPYFRADFWEGDATKQFSVKKKGFSVKRGEAIQWIRGLVRISTGKAIQWRGSGDSRNRRSLKTEKVAVLIPCPKIGSCCIVLGFTFVIWGGSLRALWNYMFYAAAALEVFGMDLAWVFCVDLFQLSSFTLGASINSQRIKDHPHPQ